MPTPSEQKALAFFAFVILLGGTVRVVRAGSVSVPTAEEQSALAHQASAADTAVLRLKTGRKARKGAKLSRSRRDGAVDTVGGVVGVPFSDVRPGHPGTAPSTWATSDVRGNGYPPPSPRIDTDNRLPTGSTGDAQAALPANRRQRLSATPTDTATIDLDVATVVQIEALPRVGPTMAARLVANRDSLGPFRSLDGLRRVRGMGPATIRQLAPLVTFSGRAASSTAGSRH
jgi:competence protein ComEA